MLQCIRRSIFNIQILYFFINWFDLFVVVVTCINGDGKQKIGKLSSQAVVVDIFNQLQENVLRQIGSNDGIAVASADTKVIYFLVVLFNQLFKSSRITGLYPCY